MSPELDDDYSLASSTTSLSPNSDLDTFPGEPTEDENDDNFFSSPEVSPGAESIYQPLEQYPLHTPHERQDYLDDDDLSPLTFSPPSSLPLNLLSLSQSSHEPSIKNSSNYSPPIQPYNFSSFDYDSSSVPCSPSRRRSTTLPELEPTSFNSDLFGLHKSIPSDGLPSPDIDMDDISAPRWRSFPGCETDDDLIPMELASKNYIPDPSASVPTTSTGARSLLLWDHDHNDRSDIPRPLSPSPENFYLDPSVLAECGDEELQQVYELRQRTSKSEKWERERCRELSALLRLKLDERGVIGGGGSGGGEGGDCSSNHHSLSCCSDLPFSSSSPSSDSLTVSQPQPFSSSSSPTQNNSTLSSSPSSTLPSTLEYPHTQQSQQGPKHKIRSMSQLVASMLFHRQSDALRRHPSRKAAGPDSSTCGYSHPSSMGGGDAGTKMLSKRRSALSKVILPEELELDSEKEQQGVEDDDGGEDVNLDGEDGSLGRSCSDMELDEEAESSSHNLTWSVPELCES